MAETKIVKVDIIDDEGNLDSFYLINPNREKLEELKNMIEHRFDYMFNENISDEEIEKAEKFCQDVWDNIYKFVEDNFNRIIIDEVFEINY